MNKDLDYYMNLNYKMEIIEDELEDGYILSYPELKGCVTTADTIEEGIQNLKDAKKEWLNACLEDNINVPEPYESEKFSGQYRLRMPKSLHRDITICANKEGISINQYCVYVLSKEIGKVK